MRLKAWHDFIMLRQASFSHRIMKGVGRRVLGRSGPCRNFKILSTVNLPSIYRVQ